MENNKTKNMWTNSVLSYTCATLILLIMSHLPMFVVNIVQISQLVWSEVKQEPSATGSRQDICTLQIAVTMWLLLGFYFFHSLIFVSVTFDNRQQNNKILKSSEAGSKAKKGL